MTANTAMQLGVFALHTTFFVTPHIGTYVAHNICADRLLRTEPQVCHDVSIRKHSLKRPHVAQSD